MNLRIQAAHCSGAMLVFSLAIPGRAATVTFTSRQEAVGMDDIANLQGATEERENVNAGDNDASYIADDRPPQGQSFTTGTNAAGYLLRAVTLREVTFDTYALVPDLNYTVRITRPAGRKLSVLATETAKVAGNAPGNFPTRNDGDQLGRGSGSFITFTLEKPVLLRPGTTYGFDISGGAERHYWQWDGTRKDTYAGGAAYSALPGEKLAPRTGDHVFVVGLTALVGKDGRNERAAADVGTGPQVANKATESE